MPVQTRRSLNQKRKAVDDATITCEHCTIDDKCAICHETLHSSRVYHLPCGHSFHTGCIERQIQAGSSWSNLCALCRTDHEDTFGTVPALRAIQNTWQRRVRRRIGLVNIAFEDGRHAIGYAMGDDLGGETPPFLMFGTPDGGWAVAVPHQGPASADDDDEAIAGPVDEPTADPVPAEPTDVEMGSSTPDSLPPLIPLDESNSSTPDSLPSLIDADVIDEDDWPMLDDVHMNEDDDPDSREIDYPEDDSEDDSDEYSEEGIHLYNTYVPYPRGFYRFSNRPGERQ